MPTQMKERTIEPSFLDGLENNPLKTAVKFYAARLPLNDKAVAFLADQFKLTVQQAAEQRIGFSDRRLGKNLPTTDSQRGRDLARATQRNWTLQIVRTRNASRLCDVSPVR